MVRTLFGRSDQPVTHALNKMHFPYFSCKQREYTALFCWKDSGSNFHVSWVSYLTNLSVTADNFPFPDWTSEVPIAEATVSYRICLTREFRCHPPAIRHNAHLFIVSTAARKAEQEMNNHSLAHFIHLRVFYTAKLLQILRQNN